MFERYTEQARRAIFFARYEASCFGSDYIETQHLLLGLLREDKILRERVPIEGVRREVEKRSLPAGKRISTSVDIPLDHDSKRALGFTAEEAERLNQGLIHCGHMVLGLLRVEKCQAAELLRNHGIQLNVYRDIVPSYPYSFTESEDVGTPVTGADELEAPPMAPALLPLIQRLDGLITRSLKYLTIDGAAGQARLPRLSLTRHEAMGHLLDWATAHHQWFARAMVEPKLATPGYPQAEWIAHENYKEFPSHKLMQAWMAMNHLIVHLMRQIPPAKLEMPCRVGISDPVTLYQLIERYVAHVEDVMGQLLALHH